MLCYQRSHSEKEGRSKSWFLLISIIVCVGKRTFPEIYISSPLSALALSRELHDDVKLEVNSMMILSQRDAYLLCRLYEHAYLCICLLVFSSLSLKRTYG